VVVRKAWRGTIQGDGMVVKCGINSQILTDNNGTVRGELRGGLKWYYSMVFL
jgi:hypothetical protein